ncbi:cyclic nucleotide-binding domain [Cystoisospora suis]|uniref:Cyclic nucleotide-binding domain n=1 Tax=Cystoisospora suis TaxID=483139 RepID=A0A2C6KZ27_9APIC|nr:cyclic nucleotide-binding domain [Cystoisospora suis]
MAGLLFRPSVISEGPPFSISARRGRRRLVCPPQCRGLPSSFPPCSSCGCSSSFPVPGLVHEERASSPWCYSFMRVGRPGACPCCSLLGGAGRRVPTAITSEPKSAVDDCSGLRPVLTACLDPLSSGPLTSRRRASMSFSSFSLLQMSMYNARRCGGLSDDSAVRSLRSYKSLESRSHSSTPGFRSPSEFHRLDDSHHTGHSQPPLPWLFLRRKVTCHNKFSLPSAGFSSPPFSHLSSALPPAATLLPCRPSEASASATSRDSGRRNLLAANVPSRLLTSSRLPLSTSSCRSSNLFSSVDARLPPYCPEVPVKAAGLRSALPNLQGEATDSAFLSRLNSSRAFPRLSFSSASSSTLPALSSSPPTRSIPPSCPSSPATSSSLSLTSSSFPLPSASVPCAPSSCDPPPLILSPSSVASASSSAPRHSSVVLRVPCPPCTSVPSVYGPASQAQGAAVAATAAMAVAERLAEISETLECEAKVEGMFLRKDKGVERQISPRVRQRRSRSFFRRYLSNLQAATAAGISDAGPPFRTENVVSRREQFGLGGSSRSGHVAPVYMNHQFPVLANAALKRLYNKLFRSAQPGLGTGGSNGVVGGLRSSSMQKRRRVSRPPCRTDSPARGKGLREKEFVSPCSFSRKANNWWRRRKAGPPGSEPGQRLPFGAARGRASTVARRKGRRSRSKETTLRYPYTREDPTFRVNLVDFERRGEALGDLSPCRHPTSSPVVFSISSTWQPDTAEGLVRSRSDLGRVHAVDRGVPQVEENRMASGEDGARMRSCDSAAQPRRAAVASTASEGRIHREKYPGEDTQKTVTGKGKGTFRTDRRTVTREGEASPGVGVAPYKACPQMKAVGGVRSSLAAGQHTAPAFDSSASTTNASSSRSSGHHNSGDIGNMGSRDFPPGRQNVRESMEGTSGDGEMAQSFDASTTEGLHSSPTLLLEKDTRRLGPSLFQSGGIGTLLSKSSREAGLETSQRKGLQELPLSPTCGEKDVFPVSLPQEAPGTPSSLAENSCPSAASLRNDKPIRDPANPPCKPSTLVSAYASSSVSKEKHALPACPSVPAAEATSSASPSLPTLRGKAPQQSPFADSSLTTDPSPLATIGASGGLPDSSSSVAMTEAALLEAGHSLRPAVSASFPPPRPPETAPAFPFSVVDAEQDEAQRLGSTERSGGRGSGFLGAPASQSTINRSIGETGTRTNTCQLSRTSSAQDEEKASSSLVPVQPSNQVLFRGPRGWEGMWTELMAYVRRFLRNLLWLDWGRRGDPSTAKIRKAMPPSYASKVGERVSHWCLQNGNILITVGSVLSLTGTMMSDMRLLRSFNLLAGVCFFSYNYTRSPRSTDAAAWNVVFLCLNSFMLYRYLTEHNEVAFTNEELDVFEKYFLPAGLSPRRFRTLLALGQWHLLPPGSEITQAGKPVRQLVFVTRGRVDLLQHGDTVAHYHGGDRDAVIGLESFLSYVSALRRLAALGEQQHKKSGRPGSQPVAEGVNADGLEANNHAGGNAEGDFALVATPSGQAVAGAAISVNTLGESSLDKGSPGSLFSLVKGREGVQYATSELPNTSNASAGQRVERGREQQNMSEAGTREEEAQMRKDGLPDISKPVTGDGKVATAREGGGKDRDEVRSSNTHEPEPPGHDAQSSSNGAIHRPEQVAKTDNRADSANRDSEASRPASLSSSSVRGLVAENVSCRDEGDQEDDEEEALFSEDDSPDTSGREEGNSISPVCRQTLPSYVHEASVVSEDEEDQEALLLTPPAGRFRRPGPRKGEQEEEEAGSVTSSAQVQQIAETLQTGRAAHMTTVCVTDCEVLVFDIEDIAKAVLNDPVKVGFPVLQGLASVLVERSFAQSQRLAVQSYDSVLAGVLADGTVQDEERRFLREWRARRGISEAQHIEALHRLGWSEEEFQRGERMSASSGITAKVGRALYSLATFSWLTSNGQKSNSHNRGGGTVPASVFPAASADGTTGNGEKVPTYSAKTSGSRKERTSESAASASGTISVNSEKSEENRPQHQATGSEAGEESLQPDRVKSSSVNDNRNTEQDGNTSPDSDSVRDATF